MEMKLFNETIKGIKESKLFNYATNPEYGNDFSINVNSNLLNPSFYIYETFVGETLVNEIAFDREKQEFFVRESGLTLTQSEVLQHVKRGLIEWATGSDFSYLTDEETLRDASQLIDQLRTPEYAEFVKISKELLTLPETMRRNFQDMCIGMFEAETEERISEIRAIYMEFSNTLIHRADVQLSRLKDLAEEKQSTSGIMAKLVRLFR